MIALGTIVVPAAGSANNKNTGVPFSIPYHIQRLLIVTPNVAGTWNVVVGQGNNLAAQNGALPDFDVGVQTATQVDCPPAGANDTIIAIFNSGAGGSVFVYGLYNTTNAQN